MAILESSENDIQILKEALSNILDLIVNSEIKSKITEKLRYEPTIILDDAIIKNSKLVNNLSNALGFINSIKLNSWTDLTNDVLGKFLILSYRDQGKFPNYFYPNLIEYNYEGQNRGKAILINFLFGNHYRWSKYFILKEYQKYLTNTIRENNFGWNELKKSIQLQKPESKLYIDWNLENEFSNSDSRETFKVKTINQRAKTYHSSDFIIYSERNLQKPRIERMKWVFENLDFEDTKYDIQKLDELLSDFNPAESLIDTTQQELDLQIIRDQLGLENESAGRIWKTLLRKKSELLGIESLYEELKTIFNKYSIPLVSINYFRSSWINVESDTLIPRGNKVFKVLCDYLNLNNNYRLIIFRLKNASISGKIEATKKYSSLLKDLFADGCFDGNSSKQTILQSKMHHYKNNHALDEIGIDIDNPMNGLVSLIELIQPELKLSELEIIEKN
jgi:hypothetical protein